MFLYRPPKAMCWGHAARPRDHVEASEKLNSFFDKYFERIEPDEHDGRASTFKLNWKSSAMPNAQWPEQFLKPENKHLRLLMFILMGDRISFPLGIIFPIPLNDPASYDFLKRFGSDTPFKMTAKHFSVVVPIGKKGKHAARKPDAEIAARLNEVFP
jgi:hypothetical protein